MTGESDRPPFIGPNVDYVECHGCGRALEPSEASGIDLSSPDEYYPRMVPICPSCKTNGGPA